MNKTKAQWAHGSRWEIGGLKVAEMDSIGTPQLDRDEEDVTSHDSPDNFDEFLMTLKRSGTIPMSGNFIEDDPGQLEVARLYGSGERVPMAIETPSGNTRWEFDAYVKSINTGSLERGKIPFNVVLRVSGRPRLIIDGIDALGGVTGVTRATGATVVGGKIVNVRGGAGSAYNDVVLEFETNTTVGANWASKTLTIKLVAGTDYTAKAVNDLIVNATGTTPVGVLQDQIKVQVEGEHSGTDWAAAPAVTLAGGEN